CMGMIGLAVYNLQAGPKVVAYPLPSNAFQPIGNNIQIQDSIIADSTDLIQVAFRKVHKQNLMGEVQSVNLAQVIEKNYTTNSLENLDAFVSGYNGNIWGNSDYLVLVDGFPRDADNVMPTEIDQISVLKDVNAVALYGS